MESDQAFGKWCKEQEFELSQRTLHNYRAAWSDKPALAALRQEIPDWDERVELGRTRQTVQDAPPLAEHGGDRKSEGKNQGNNITLIERGTSAPYLAARLKRD